eukprot:scaffold236966_cov27-Tisochrysis_lutea.AAC.2
MAKSACGAGACSEHRLGQQPDDEAGDEPDEQHECPAEQCKVAKAVAAASEDHQICLVADGGREGGGGAEHHDEHDLRGPQPLNLDGTKHRVEKHDGGSIGDDTRKKRGEEEDEEEKGEGPNGCETHEARGEHR